MRRFPTARQPAGPAPLLPGFKHLRASYITQGGAYSTDTGPQSLRGFFNIGTGSFGVVAAPNANDRTVSMGLPSSQAVYEFLCLFEVRTADVTSATSATRFLTAAQDGSANASAIIAGSATGLISGETLTVLDSGLGRTGITDSLAVGPHSLLVYWDGTQYQFVLDGLPRTATNGSNGAAALITSGGHVGGRTLAGAAWICPALSVINPTPAATLRRVVGNPWQIFQPQTARIYSFPSGASGTTVSVPAGSLTLTGFAPTVTVTANQLIAVPSGSLSLTGFEPTVLNGANQVIQVPVGSIVLTGYTPTVVSTANQTIAVPAGSLIITGYAPTVRVGNDQIVVVPAGSLTLTGYAPTIVTTNNKFISVPIGTLILTGYAPTVIGGEITTKGGRGWTESERRLNERLRRLALQQARWEDDEEALAILLASIIRR